MAFRSHLTPGWSLSQGNKKTVFTTAWPQGLPARSQWGLEKGASALEAQEAVTGAHGLFGLSRTGLPQFAHRLAAERRSLC